MKKQQLELRDLVAKLLLGIAAFKREFKKRPRDNAKCMHLMRRIDELHKLIIKPKGTIDSKF